MEFTITKKFKTIITEQGEKGLYSQIQALNNHNKPALNEKGIHVIGYENTIEMLNPNYKIYFHHESGTSGVIGKTIQSNRGENLRITGLPSLIWHTKSSLLELTTGLNLEEIE